MKRLPPLARRASRVALVVVAAAVVIVIGLQFFGIVAKNVALARDVSAAHGEIRLLHAREHEQRRTIRRLSDPRGAIPEIHDRLQLVGPHEELIYLRGGPAPTPAPNDLRPQP